MRSYLWAILVTTLMLVPTFPRAEDPLADLANSNDVRKLGTRNHLNEAKRDEILQRYPDSNMSKLFLGKDPGTAVSNWLRPADRIYILRHTEGRRLSDFVRVAMNFSEEGALGYSVLVLIPHPTALPMVELGVIEDFDVLKPPRLKIERTEVLDLDGTPANLYYRDDGKCSVVIDRARGSIIEAKIDSCTGVANLIDFAKSLDLENFDRKLNS